MIIKKMTQFFTTGLMASALIFSYGTGSAFANEDTIATPISDETTTEGSKGETTDETTTEETTEESISVETTTEESAEEIEEVESPVLVPGDFFYFVKSFMEKIRLAVTTDDYKEAKLLVDFATERIAEANVLITEGKTEEAAKVLQEAIATQETAR